MQKFDLHYYYFSLTINSILLIYDLTISWSLYIMISYLSNNLFTKLYLLSIFILYIIHRPSFRNQENWTYQSIKFSLLTNNSKILSLWYFVSIILEVDFILSNRSEDWCRQAETELNGKISEWRRKNRCLSLINDQRLKLSLIWNWYRLEDRIN